MEEEVFKRNYSILKKAILEVNENSKGDSVTLLTSVTHAMQEFIHAFAVSTEIPVATAEELFIDAVKRPKTEGN